MGFDETIFLEIGFLMNGLFLKMVERWISVAYNPVYLVSTLGSIKNSKTGRILKLIFQRDGYIRVSLSKNGNRKQFYVHRLVAFHYIPNNNSYPTVDHIDNDRGNNKVDNLRWATYSQQVKNVRNRGKLTRKVAVLDSKTRESLQVYDSITEAVAKIPGSDSRLVSMVCRGKRKTHAGYAWKYMDTESYIDEKWIKMDEYRDFCVSNCGRIRVKDGRITSGSLSNGYRRVHLKRNDGSECHKFVHVLVSQHFIPIIEGSDCVNHKDGNRQNNKVGNLEWCSYSENSLHAYETGLNGYARRIQQRNIKDGTKTSFKSIQEASNKMDIPYHRIWYTLISRRIDREYEWTYCK